MTDADSGSDDDSGQVTNPDTSGGNGNPSEPEVPQLSVTADNVDEKIKSLSDGENTIAVIGKAENPDNFFRRIKEALVELKEIAPNAKVILDLRDTTGITEIPKDAFYNCTNLTGFLFPKSINKIGDTAFALCDNLNNIVLPKNITEISDGLFCGCTKLKSIYIPENVKSIAEAAFMDCTSLTVVNYGKTTNDWELLKKNNIRNHNDPLLNAALICLGSEPKEVYTPADKAATAIATLESGTDDNYPSYLIKITDKTLSSEQLSDIGTAIKTLTTKENYFAFINLDLSSATEITEIPDKAFYYFYLSGLILPDSLKNIGTKAFAYNSFEEIVIPDSVEIIEAGAISFCFYLTEITLPASLTSIGASAFKSTALKTVNYKGTQAQWEALKDDGKISSTGNNALFNATIHCTDGDI